MKRELLDFPRAKWTFFLRLRGSVFEPSNCEISQNDKKNTYSAAVLGYSMSTPTAMDHVTPTMTKPMTQSTSGGDNTSHRPSITQNSNYSLPPLFIFSPQYPRFCGLSGPWATSRWAKRRMFTQTKARCSQCGRCIGPGCPYAPKTFPPPLSD